MRRRQFITLLGGAAAAWPLAARAQQRAMPEIAFFNAGRRAEHGHVMAAFREGLREHGFVEGQNVAIEYQFAENQFDRLPAMAADLVQRRVAVIAAYPRAVNAAKAATTTIPIVFLSGSDPVQLGLVASINRPDGNLTGVSMFAGQLTAKRFGLLHQAVPQAAVIGLLRATGGPGPGIGVDEAEMAARGLGVPTRSITVSSETETEAAFATFARDGLGALFVVNNLFFFTRRELLAELAVRYRIPAIYEQREHVEVGGLMSYGAKVTDANLQVGRYTGRILKGEKPANLPVMLPARFEFIINLKTAKALGLDIPPGVLAIVDEVIE